MKLFVILSIFLLGVTATTTAQDCDQDNFQTENHLEMRTRIFWPEIHTTGNCIGKCPPLLEKLSLHANLSHDDCNLYCLCLPGYQMVKQCPDNKHYSESLNQCVDPEEAQCAKKFDGCLGNCTLNHDGSSEERYLPHQNCSQFCKCKSNGRLELHECAENLHFSVENQTCMSPQDAKCKVQVNGFNGDNETEEKQDKLNTKGCSEQCPETNSPNYTVIISHTNCSYFCKCNWGNPVVIKCPESLHFNNQTKTCDSVDNAHCAVNNVNFNQSTSLKENSGVTESTFNEQQNNNVNSESNFQTAELNSNNEAHHNNKNIKSNSSESDTDFTDSIFNKNTTTVINNESNNNNNNNNNNNKNSSIDSQNNIDDECIGSCPSSDSNKVFALVHTDCRKYCTCVNGFPVVKNCSAGLYFDKIIRQCVISEFSKCRNNNQEEKQDSAQSTTDQNKSPNKNYDTVVFQSNRTQVNNDSQDFLSSNANSSKAKKDNELQ